MEIGARLPNFRKSFKIIKLLELSRQYASNEPSTTFQSCRKLKLCLFLHFEPQMPKDPLKMAQGGQNIEF